MFVHKNQYPRLSQNGSGRLSRPALAREVPMPPYHRNLLHWPYCHCCTIRSSERPVQQFATHPPYIFMGMLLRLEWVPWFGS